MAASSRPRQLIVTTLKKREKHYTGQPYKPSKQDSAQSRNINWKSPAYWPLIDQVVREWVGKPNLTEIVWIIKSRNTRYEHLTHQQLSDWQDKTQGDKFVWSKQTLQDVAKGFLPGGDQTRHNIFVSFLCLAYRPITDGV